MRKLITVAALLLAAALPSAASAQFFVGARLGYGFPWGDAQKDQKLKDQIKGEVPIQVDAGLKLGQALAVGVYGSYAVAMLSNDRKDACDAANVTCKGNELRLGAQVNLHAANTPNSEFWGGVAVGWMRGNFTLPVGPGATADVFSTGFEGAIQGGLDYLLNPSFRIGPFASISVGQFTKYGGDLGDGDITDKTFHGFFTIGLRGMFGG